MQEVLTIFTPTYNRQDTLPRLYESLCNQTSYRFKWLVVDDGSTDNTESLIKKWVLDKRIKIRYYKQSNMGKAMAHNKGVELSETELFVCVDSDDYLTSEAVVIIIYTWEYIKDKNYVGILAYRGRHGGGEITQCRKKIESATLRNSYRKYVLVGDTMLIYKRELLLKYPFPFFEGEKFVPESYLYDRIDTVGKLYFIHKILYIGEYLENGYTKNMRKVIKKNPNGYIEYINYRIKIENGIISKCTDILRYIAVAKCKCLRVNKIIEQSVSPFLTIILYPLGLFFYIKLYKKIGEGL